MATENKGLIVLGITVPILTMAVLVIGGWTYDVGQKQAVQEVTLNMVTATVNTLKLDTAQVQLTGAQIKGKVDAMDRRLTEMQTDARSLETKVDAHMQSQMAMQREILEAINKKD